MSRLLALALILPAPLLAADGPTIVDAAGKEIVLKNWKLSAGTRKLDWLGVEALAFRETNSTGFRDGVMTFIPLDRLESLAYDAEKQTVKAKVAGSDAVIEGFTKYAGINQIAVDAEIDKGTAGIVELKYRGGAPKGGIRSIKFPAAKPAPAPAGDKLWVVIADGKKKEAPLAVHNLKALYRVEKGAEAALSWVMFKKTYKVELADIKRLTAGESEDPKSFECVVTLKDGTEQTLTLLGSVTIDGKPATLEGLIAEVPAGYKLFPLHTVGEVNREEPTAAPEKKADD